MIEVRVDGLLIDSSSNSPVVLLRELDGDRILPIYIGPFEASAPDEVSAPDPGARLLEIQERQIYALARIERALASRMSAGA